ncbi:low molecular weight phosphotyrosine protein phosphatase [Parvularcula sp. ZS-1/3]|uniref:protein-tyrosine-phosphatase n=1 Tax=Parvularcula mediterranea TaxID=2732508 RepID=A0A7Y3RLM6_9PROT|nr:low molecular weight protein-tyrosine-phosphatase [Parvularcula mediterranea]NNU15821.1 low molecular weight phosphotyrosine protein phosphatase [Parvularcula mediterranea]
MTSVLFVCLGNICRSPAAEGVFRKRAAEAGLDVAIDSAGTGGWHEGALPDPRMMKAAAARGYDLSPIRARKIDDGDGYTFSHILAMDASNLADIEDRRLPDWTADVRMLLDRDVPDPYYGGDQGFEEVLDLLEDGIDALIAELKQNG